MSDDDESDVRINAARQRPDLCSGLRCRLFGKHRPKSECCEQQIITNHSCYPLSGNFKLHDYAISGENSTKMMVVTTAVRDTLAPSWKRAARDGAHIPSMISLV